MIHEPEDGVVSKIVLGEGADVLFRKIALAGAKYLRRTQSPNEFPLNFLFETTGITLDADDEFGGENS
jgi:hypothetical protein